MAPKQTFLLVSLSDSKAKKLAEVIQNNTCRNILDYLSHKNATESELAKELGIPLPTVHYNIKHLVEAHLVKNDEFHYSAKGKEVMHYSLAKQFVIIAPAGAQESIREKLKTLIPTFAIVGAAAIAIKLIGRSITVNTENAPAAMMQAAPALASRAMSKGAENIAEGAEMVAADRTMTEGMRVIAQQTVSAPLWAWFLIGAVSAVLIYLIAEFVTRKVWRKE